MQKVHDTIFPFPLPSPPGSKCRLRIFREEGGQTVVIVSHIPGNRGTSITNAIEEVATKVLRVLPEHFASPDQETLWVQDYPPGSLSLEKESLVQLVTFDRAGNILIRPRWTRVTEDHAQASFFCGLLSQ